MNPQISNEISVAVLPIRDLSPDGDQAYFANGLTEDLITDLSRFGSLRILASQSTQDFNDAPTPEQIQALDIDYLVKGSFLQVGGDIRIRIQLILAGTGTLVWGERYHESADSIFRVQEAIIQKIAHILQLQIKSDRLAHSYRKSPTSLAAYDHWLRGMDELRKGSLDNDLTARRHFEEALKLDAHYARAHTGLSLSYFNEWSCQLWDRWEVSQKGAQHYALKAIEIDDNDYLAQAVLGRTYLYEAEYDKAEHCLRKSLQLNPNDADNLIHIASCLTYLGYPEEAVMLYQKAVRINPYSPDWHLAYGMMFYLELGDVERALEIGVKVGKGTAWVDFPAYMAGASYLVGELEQMEVYWQQYLEEHRLKITRAAEVDPERALTWTRDVNPYRHGSRLEAFWAYIGGSAGGRQAVPKSSTAAHQFVDKGDLWELRFQGMTATVVAAKGLQDIHRLLAEPGKAFHCSELMGVTLQDSHSPTLIDEQAKREYQDRIRQLQAEIEEAESFQQSERLERLRDEYDQLLEHLSAALGLAGKVRKAGTSVEKARSAVTWRIRAAIKKIAAVHPALGQHLTQSIKTGTHCSYQPNQPVDWYL